MRETCAWRGSSFTVIYAVGSALPHCRVRGDWRRTARDSLRTHEDRGDRGRRGRSCYLQSRPSQPRAAPRLRAAACRLYRAKGKVERPFRYIRERLLPRHVAPQPRTSTSRFVAGLIRSPILGCTQPRNASPTRPSPKKSRTSPCPRCSRIRRRDPHSSKMACSSPPMLPSKEAIKVALTRHIAKSHRPATDEGPIAQRMRRPCGGVHAERDAPPRCGKMQGRNGGWLWRWNRRAAWLLT